jgi:hypothetical protein
MGWLTTKLLGYVSGGLLLALLAVSGLLWAERIQHATTKATGELALAKIRADVEADRLASEREARTREAGIRAEYDRAAQVFEKERDDAKALVDDLLGGNRRLRREWAACETTARVSGATTAAGIPDGDAEVRREGIRRVLGIVAECQAHVRGLQSVVRAWTN